MTYTKLCSMLDEDVNDRFTLILGCDDIQVRIASKTNKYYYLEGGMNDASECFGLQK